MGPCQYKRDTGKMSWQPFKLMMEISTSEMNGGTTWVNSPLFFKGILFNFGSEVVI